MLPQSFLRWNATKNMENLEKHSTFHKLPASSGGYLLPLMKIYVIALVTIVLPTLRWNVQQVHRFHKILFATKKIF